MQVMLTVILFYCARYFYYYSEFGVMIAAAK